MTRDKERLSRRQLFTRCSAIALGSSCALSTLGRLQLAHAQTDAEEDYKALVCVFLFGGNDAFNMVVPRSTAEYASYSASRLSLAVEQNTLIPINNSQQGVDYGFHPAFTELANLYSQNKLAVLANVGALVEPTTKAQYQAKSVLLPPQLFSHNDQQNFIQSLQSSRQRNGWAGRAADAFGSVNGNTDLSMNISLSGSNMWQSGANSTPYSVNPEGLKSLQHVNRSSEDERDIARTQLLQNVLNMNHQHILTRAYAQQLAKAWDLADELGTALESIDSLSTVFPENNRMASGLSMAAKLIAARNTLNAKRQTFFIGVGDFDTHGDQVRRHTLLMQQINAALAAFYQATVELGIADKVTTFTASDFGRTLTSNGDGTDHGWGSHQLIMGGAVKGGDIYGQMPDLAINSNDDMGEGRIIPTTSMDQYAASLATWFGLSPSAYADVFPNLSYFNSAQLGFI